MSKTRPPYSPEFRRQMVDLVRAGRSPENVSREFEPTAQSISTWVSQADKQEGRREEKVDGLTTQSGCTPPSATGRLWPTKQPRRRLQQNPDDPSSQTLHENGAASIYSI